MAKGKSQFCTWTCQECGTITRVSTYNKRNTDKTAPVLKKHCKKCRKHTSVKRKDTKKGGGQQAKGK